MLQQIVKQLWAYIKKNNLQDPNNKRKIICDDALRLVFETDCTDMFKMNKLLAKHIIPFQSTSNLLCLTSNALFFALTSSLIFSLKHSLLYQLLVCFFMFSDGPWPLSSTLGSSMLLLWGLCHSSSLPVRQWIGFIDATLSMSLSFSIS